MAASSFLACSRHSEPAADTGQPAQTSRHSAADTDPHADHDTDDGGDCQHSGMATEDLSSSIGLTCATVLTVGLFALCLFG